MKQKSHPFSYTLGPGPYRYVALISIRISPTFGTRIDGPKLKVERGIGTCAHCCHAIMDSYIVETGDKKLYGVGSDCIRKVGLQLENSSKFERDLAAIKRQKGREYREKKRLEFLEKARTLVRENNKEIKALGLDNYCNNYLARHRTLNGYKIFIKKMQEKINEK